MKIVHVDDRFEPFAGYQTNELIDQHLNNNHEIIVLTSFDPLFSNRDSLLSQDEELFRTKGIKVIRMKETFKISSRYYYKNLDKILEDIKPDVVYAHYLADFRDLWIYKKKKDFLVVRDCHMSWVASRNKFSKQFYWLYSKLIANRINASDKFYKIYALGVEEREYIKALGISDEKVEYLWHGYNNEKMFFSSEGREEVRAQFNIRKEDILIGYVGKFDEFKRPDLIFDIMSKVRIPLEKKDNIKLIFIGKQQNNYMRIFQEKLANFKFKKNVEIVKEQKFDDLYKFYSAIDIVIWPKETTLSSIHAQICHSKVIMEKHKSNEERVIEKNNLFPVGDLAVASEILSKLLENDYYKTLNVENMKSLEK